MKRWFSLCAAAFLVLVFSPATPTAVAKDHGYTLVVAPARYSVMQVAFDIIARHSAVLVSYQGEAATAEPLLHAWNGQEWVRITLSDYREVNFLQQTPNRTVLIGDAATLPAVLAEASSWSPQVVSVTELDTAALVNEFGKLFDFSEKDWKWFAARYNLDLRDENAPKRARSWYDQPGPLKRDSTFPRVSARKAPEAAPEAVEDVSPAPVTEVQPETQAPVAEPAPAPVQDAMPDADRPAVE